MYIDKQLNVFPVAFFKVKSCRAEEINEYSYCSRAVLYVDILLEETQLNFQGLKI